MTTTSAMPTQSTVDQIFGTVLEGRTWRNLLYLFLSFPLGLVYFVVTITLLSIGVGTIVIVAGIPILIITFTLVRAFVAGERVLLWKLLGASIPAPSPRRRPPGLIDRMMSYLGDAHLWKGLVYLLLHFAFGVASFALVMGLIPASLGLLTMPLTYQLAPMTVGLERITTLDQAVLCCSAGAILALLSLHLLNLWAALWKRVGTALLT